MTDEERRNEEVLLLNKIVQGEINGNPLIYEQLVKIVTGQWQHGSGPSSTDTPAEGLWKEDD